MSETRGQNPQDKDRDYQSYKRAHKGNQNLDTGQLPEDPLYDHAVEQINNDLGYIKLGNEAEEDLERMDEEMQSKLTGVPKPWRE